MRIIRDIFFTAFILGLAINAVFLVNWLEGLGR